MRIKLTFCVLLCILIIFTFHTEGTNISTSIQESTQKLEANQRYITTGQSQEEVFKSAALFQIILSYLSFRSKEKLLQYSLISHDFYFQMSKPGIMFAQRTNGRIVFLANSIPINIWNQVASWDSIQSPLEEGTTIINEIEPSWSVIQYSCTHRSLFIYIQNVINDEYTSEYRGNLRNVIPTYLVNKENNILLVMNNIVDIDLNNSAFAVKYNAYQIQNQEAILLTDPKEFRLGMKMFSSHKFRFYPHYSPRAITLEISEKFYNTIVVEKTVIDSFPLRISKLIKLTEYSSIFGKKRKHFMQNKKIRQTTVNIRQKKNTKKLSKHNLAQSFLSKLKLKKKLFSNQTE